MHKRAIAIRLFAIAVAVAVSAPYARDIQAAEPSQATPCRFEHFITRQGNRLMDGDREFRFFGANMPGLILPYDWSLYLPERLKLPTPWEQEDGFKTLDQMNLRVVRLWNLPIRDPKDAPSDGRMTWHYVQGPGVFNENSFVVVDHLLALANRYGVRVVFDFSAEAGDYLGGAKTYAAHRGKPVKDFWTDPQIKDDYKATVRYVINRKNTISGVHYRDDKAILAWQFGNEMYSATPEWLSEMAAYIKQLDPNHLVAETRHIPNRPVAIDPNIDLYTRHYYNTRPGEELYWLKSAKKEAAQLNGERPFFVGEFGPYVDNKGFTHENVVDRLREFLELVRHDENISGAMLWSMYFHHADGGFYWHQIMTYPEVWAYHWPGFPSADAQREQGILSLLRDEAFRIQNLPIPPLPIPDAPELLPFTDIPLMSWRGSAGASGYDVERAANADGPWTTIAANVSDADVAYRPLFSDTTCRCGESYYYRVVARNAAGASKPSNAVGPVLVKQACNVDELQDFSRAFAKSDSLELTNAYNALYAEYLFRARGKAGDWITYQTQGPIDSFKVTAFSAKDQDDIEFRTSADGAAFTNISAGRKSRSLPALTDGAAKGKSRTLVEYTAKPQADQRFLQIRWKGPAELDRVEILHR